MLMARFGAYGLSVYGGYGQGVADGQKFTSFFAFGAVNGPIGGPPAFFITGIGGGFGINRGLVIPTDLSQLRHLPVHQGARPGRRAAGDPMAELRRAPRLLPASRTARSGSPPASGSTASRWSTASPWSSSQIGDGFEIALLGLARMALPRPQVALV